MQSQQAAARSIRQGDRRRVGVERGDVPVSLRRSRRLEERSRQRAAHAEVGRGRSGVRLGGTTRPPRTPWHKTIVYETHVKGFTKRHPRLPEHMRGTYAGLAHPAPIEYLQKLGVTAVELLPVHQFVQDSLLARARPAQLLGLQLDRLLRAAQRVLVARARAASRCSEFKGAGQGAAPRRHRGDPRRRLQPHRRGESSRPGAVVQGHRQRAPTTGSIGDNRRYYMDYTGTGNTLNMLHPHVLQLLMDSLRYWVLEMHVDGFRFDLAATLARELHDVDRLSAFFDLIQQDPVVSQVKLIAEPWDVGEGGYQVGNFPPLWSEWNGKYRDSVRDFWRGTDQTLAEFGSRFTGSSDLYQGTARRPYASINFITAHDGFTLRDLVSLQREAQRGQRRGEPRRREPQPLVELRRRGADRRSRRSSRCGSGRCATSWRRCSCRRACRCCAAATRSAARSTATTTPTARTTRSPGTTGTAADTALLGFTRDLIRLRAEHPVFCRRRWFQGRPIRGSEVSDIGWFTPGGTEMSDEDWQAGFAKSLGVFLNGSAIPTTRRARRAGSSTTASTSCSTRTPSRSSSCCRSRSGASSGRSRSTPTICRTTSSSTTVGRPAGRRRAPAGRRPGRSCCCGACDRPGSKLADGARRRLIAGAGPGVGSRSCDPTAAGSKIEHRDPGQLPVPAPITVSAAVSLTDALTAAASEYANGGRGAVRFNFAASNVLARQIVNGAPVDLFISADEAQMDVVAAGRRDQGRHAASTCCPTSSPLSVPSDRPRTFEQHQGPRRARVPPHRDRRSSRRAGRRLREAVPREGRTVASRRVRGSFPPAASAPRWRPSSPARPTRRSSTAPTRASR